MSIDRVARQLAFTNYSQPLWARERTMRTERLERPTVERPTLGVSKPGADKEAVRVSLSTSAKAPGAPKDPGVFADFDGNKIVDGADLGMLLGEYGKKASKLDLDGDGIVNDADKELLMGAWTKSTQNAPEKPKVFGDLNEDSKVDGADLGLLLGEWGKTDSKMDLDGDGTVNDADMKLLLGAWTKPGQDAPEKPKMFGDLNDDNKVDGADLGLLLGDWGKSGSKMDLDGDGMVNGSDLKLMMQAWSKQLVE